MLYCSYIHALDFHSFPTRRSSDLHPRQEEIAGPWRSGEGVAQHREEDVGGGLRDRRVERRNAERRSEEHTSELQSLTNLVCRLLLEKKKPYLRDVRAPVSLSVNSL